MARKELETILVIVLALLSLSLYLNQFWIIYLSLAIGFSSLLFPLVGFYIHSIWTALGVKMGAASSFIILTFIFFLVLVPISLLYQVFNKDPLQLKNKFQSYWHERRKTYEKKDFKNPW